MGIVIHTLDLRIESVDNVSYLIGLVEYVTKIKMSFKSYNNDYVN
jgi:hypothetical protein